MKRELETRTVIALLAGAILLVWGPLLWAPFVYDDGLFLVANPDMGGPWPGWRYWLSASIGGYHVFEPLNFVLHFALWKAFGPGPLAFRLTSLALHWANACLIYAFFRRRIDERTAAAAALLFAIFPAHSELLAVSTFKKHLLVSFFGLGVLVFALPRGRAVLGAALLGLALLTKESALSIPLLAAAADAGAGWTKRFREKAAFWAGQAVAVGVFLCWRLLGLPVETRPLVGGRWSVHLLTSAKGFLWDVRMAAVCWPLSPESDLRPVTALRSPESVLVLSGMVLASWVVAKAWRRDRVAALGLLWFCVALAPFQNVPPALNLSLVADRYLYLAIAGALLAAARLSEGRRWARAAFAALALSWTFLSMRQAALYAYPEELWRQAAARAPSNPRAHGALASYLAAEGRYEQAEAELKQGLDLSPDWYRPTLELQLADVDARQGRLRDALVLAREAAERAPTQHSLAELGVLELRADDLEPAERHLEDALRLDPREGDALLALGQVRRSEGRDEEAEALWTRALMSEPYRVRALVELGRLRLAQGGPDAAADLFDRALKLDPADLGAIDGAAESLARRGRKAEGLALYDRLLERLQNAARFLPHDAALQSELAGVEGRVREARARFSTGKPPR